MTNSSIKPPVWFWVIGVVALLWNLMGVNMYLQQAYQTDSFKDMYEDTPELLEMVNSAPAWATAAFAIAVFAGALGCISLLLRKRWAKNLFLLSLIGIVVQMIHNLFISRAMDVYGLRAALMPIFLIVVGLFLLWYSKKAITKGWIL